MKRIFEQKTLPDGGSMLVAVDVMEFGFAGHTLRREARIPLEDVRPEPFPVHEVNREGVIVPDDGCESFRGLPFRPPVGVECSGRVVLIDRSETSFSVLRVEAGNSLSPTERDALARALRGLIQHHSDELAGRYMLEMQGLER